MDGKKKLNGNGGNALEMVCMHQGKSFPSRMRLQATYNVMRGLKSVLYIPHSSEPTCQSEILRQKSYSDVSVGHLTHLGDNILINNDLDVLQTHQNRNFVLEFLTGTLVRSTGVYIKLI